MPNPALDGHTIMLIQHAKLNGAELGRPAAILLNGANGGHP